MTIKSEFIYVTGCLGGINSSPSVTTGGVLAALFVMVKVGTPVAICGRSGVAAFSRERRSGARGVRGTEGG